MNDDSLHVCNLLCCVKLVHNESAVNSNRPAVTKSCSQMCVLTGNTSPGIWRQKGHLLSNNWRVDQRLSRGLCPLCFRAAPIMPPRLSRASDVQKEKPLLFTCVRRATLPRLSARCGRRRRRKRRRREIDIDAQQLASG